MLLGDVWLTVTESRHGDRHALQARALAEQTHRSGG